MLQTLCRCVVIDVSVNRLCQVRLCVSCEATRGSTFVCPYGFRSLKTVVDAPQAENDILELS